MQQVPLTISHIKGWGVDLDRSLRPAVPKERTPPRGVHIHWTVPEQQTAHVKVFHSIERPDMTPTFGTSSPPKGLSGLIRSLAYKLSEQRISRWMLLLFADRVNVIEGLADDLVKGRLPRVFDEMGWQAELKYNEQKAPQKVLVAAGLLGIATFFIVSKMQKKN